MQEVSAPVVNALGLHARAAARFVRVRLPNFSTRSSVMRTDCCHVVFVVAMILTMSSKSVEPQRRRPNPERATHSCDGELRVSATKPLVST